MAKIFERRRGLYFTGDRSCRSARVGTTDSKAASATSSISAAARRIAKSEFRALNRGCAITPPLDGNSAGAHQAPAALNRLRLAADFRITGEQQDVTLALAIPLDMIMFDVFDQRPAQGALTQREPLGQALLLHRPDPALRIGIQVRTAGRQRERFNRPDAVMARNDPLPLNRGTIISGAPNTFSFSSFAEFSPILLGPVRIRY
jgi:hypothetical protein